MSHRRLHRALGLALVGAALLLAPGRSWSSGALFHIKQHVDNPGQTPMKPSGGSSLDCSITCANGSGTTLLVATADQCAAACAGACGSACSQL
jgi:hypothetical protein